MNNYHIFAIKKEVYNVYKDNEYSLFKLLYNLYNLNKTDLNYGITLYNQLCYPINIKKLEEYLKLIDNIRKNKNRYMIKENTYSELILKPSNIIYKTNNISKNITYILNSYYKYLFICEFNKKEYNWINLY
ncbi:MAG: sporulation inhibitor of replication protein SirA [Bacilli bacterium]